MGYMRHMSKLYALPIVLTLGACSSLPTYQDKLTTLNLNYDAERRDPTSAPVTSRVTSREYITKFKTKVCVGLSDKDCKGQWYKATYSKLSTHYYLAAMATLTASCHEDPVDCGPEQWEQLAITSHNEELERRRAYALEALAHIQAGTYDQWQARLAGRERQRLEAERLAEAANEASECTTTYDEGSITTKCE